MAVELKKEEDALVAKIGDKAGGQAALESLTALAEDKGSKAQPFLVASFDKIMDAFGDKSKNVKDAALVTSKSILKVLSPMFSSSVCHQKQWRVRVGSVVVAVGAFSRNFCSFVTFAELYSTP